MQCLLVLKISEILKKMKEKSARVLTRRVYSSYSRQTYIRSKVFAWQNEHINGVDYCDVALKINDFMFKVLKSERSDPFMGPRYKGRCEENYEKAPFIEEVSDDDDAFSDEEGGLGYDVANNGQQAPGAVPSTKPSAKDLVLTSARGETLLDLICHATVTLIPSIIERQIEVGYAPTFNTTPVVRFKNHAEVHIVLTAQQWFSFQGYLPTILRWLTYSIYLKHHWPDVDGGRYGCTLRSYRTSAPLDSGDAEGLSTRIFYEKEYCKGYTGVFLSTVTLDQYGHGFSIDKSTAEHIYSLRNEINEHLCILYGKASFVSKTFYVKRFV